MRKLKNTSTYKIQNTYKIQKFGGKWWLYSIENENEKYMFDTKKQAVEYCKKFSITVSK